jgi:hypothetical protein
MTDRRHLLDNDQPGAPPGFLLDPDDTRAHDRIPPLTADEIPPFEDNPLAQGAGEEEDDR